MRHWFRFCSKYLYKLEHFQGDMSFPRKSDLRNGQVAYLKDYYGFVAAWRCFRRRVRIYLFLYWPPVSNQRLGNILLMAIIIGVVVPAGYYSTTPRIVTIKSFANNVFVRLSGRPQWPRSFANSTPQRTDIDRESPLIKTTNETNVN